jgi:hypothetical protein
VEYIRQFITGLIYILSEMSPYLILGFFFAGLLHLLVPKERVRQYMGNNSLGSVFNASLFGIPLPLCSCGVIPTGLSFYRHGASKASTVSFLISTPQTGVDSIFVTYSMLGLPLAIIRPLVAFVTGLFGGMITKRADPVKEELSAKGNEEDTDVIPNGFLPRIKEMFRYAFVEFLQDISKWLVAGLLIAALISVVVPDDFFAQKISNDFLGMILILIVSIPVYICATASVPVAAVLILKGLSPGAALVLLMAGPATNAATITMITKVLGKRSLAGYLGAIVTGALTAGLMIDYLLPDEWFAIPEHLGMMTHQHGMLPDWLKLTSGVALILLIINGYILKRINSKKLNKKRMNSPAFSTDNIHVIKVEGMTCNHCKSNVEESIREAEGVRKVEVDLTTGMVNITGEKVDMEGIRSGIESIGYRVAEADG